MITVTLQFQMLPMLAQLVAKYPTILTAATAQTRRPEGVLMAGLRRGGGSV